MTYFVAGLLRPEICERLRIKLQTLKNHFRQIHLKTGTASPEELMKWALENSWERCRVAKRDLKEKP